MDKWGSWLIYSDWPPLPLSRVGPIMDFDVGAGSSSTGSHEIGLELYQIGHEAFFPITLTIAGFFYLGSKV